MSIYAHLPISGLLAQSTACAWYIPTTSHPSQTFRPSTSMLYTTSGSRLSSLQNTRTPTIVIQEHSLDTTLDDTLNDCYRLPQTPAKERLLCKDNVSDSPVLSWLDEQTLTSTPRTPPSKENTFGSTTKHDLQCRKTSSESLFTPEESISPVEAESEINSNALPSAVNISSLFQQRTQEIHKPIPPALTATMSPLPTRHLPKLRRSNGSDDLRSLYHSAALVEPAVQARSGGPATVAVLFEEQLTLAILAEMDRFPNRFLAPHRASESRAPRWYSGRSALSILGNALRDVVSLMTQA